MKARRQGRCSAAEREMRVGVFVQWARAEVPRARMLAMAEARWGLQARTVDEYLNRARKVIEREAGAGLREEFREAREAVRAVPVDELPATPVYTEMPDRDDVLLRQVNRLNRIADLALGAGDLNAALKALDQLAGIHGLKYADRDDDTEAVEDRQRRAHDAFREMMTGASASRASRGLADIPAPGAA